MTSINTNTGVIADISNAANQTYATLIERGLPPEEVHRMTVCYEASSLVVASLVEMGHKAWQETHSDESRSFDQNYGVVETPEGKHIVADLTWQQFLPKEKITAEMPKVLVGTRDEVRAQLRSYGIDDETLKLWEPQSMKMNIEEQKHADMEADRAAEEAAAKGGWEKFIAA